MAYRRGHSTGTKREKKGYNDWYAKYAQENLERVEREWKEQQEKQAQHQD